MGPIALKMVSMTLKKQQKGLRGRDKDFKGPHGNDKAKCNVINNANTSAVECYRAELIDNA